MKVIFRMRKGPIFLLAITVITSAITVGWADNPPNSSGSPAASWTWAFDPGEDAFSPDALLDLRSLNEKIAGTSGFVRADKSGQLVLGDGRPARFWAVNTDVGEQTPYVDRPLWKQKEPLLETQARFLAKRGVNMCRFFALVTPAAESSLDQLKQSELDWMQRGVAAMKKEGIYSTLTPYWSNAAKSGPAWGLDDNGGPQMYGLLFFDEKLQAAYKSWWKKILTSPNPYTGIPLGKDPAVAILQLQDEDSLLFWTFGQIKGGEKAKLAKLYGNFLAKKYGSVEKAFGSWKDEMLPLDDVSAGTADFLNLYEFTQPRPVNGHQQRLTDQLQFLTETMYRFNKMMGDYIHKDLGCKQLVNANSWITVNTTLLNDAERYSYQPNEVMAINRYFGGIHEGPNKGWAIVNGDHFTNPSVLTDPREFPLSLKQVVGKPMIITESNWSYPDGHGAEGPFLVAAYSSLNGVQGFYWFSMSTDGWTPPESANGYLPSQAIFESGSPSKLGTFPAAALMYRKGYVKQGEPAVVEQRSLHDIYTGTSPIISEASTFDPNRQKGSFAPQNNIPDGVDPLAFLVGPVQTIYGGDAAKSKVIDLSKYIDTTTKTVTSDTGQLMFNYDTGYCTVNTPCAQGVAAFFSKHPDFALTDVTLTSHNEHGSVLVVSMDERPIVTSAKLLVQVGMGSRPTGWKEMPTQFTADNKSFDGFTVTDVGHAPWQMNNVDLSLTVRNPLLKKAEVLDPNGNAIGTVALQATKDGVQFTFPSNAMYVVLQQ